MRDCLTNLRALPASVGNSVFVIDARKKLFGAVDLAKLLAAPDDTTLDTAADGPGIVPSTNVRACERCIENRE